MEGTFDRILCVYISNWVEENVRECTRNHFTEKEKTVAGLQRQRRSKQNKTEIDVQCSISNFSLQYSCDLSQSTSAIRIP